jgi:uncharacterized membrane protein
MTNAERVTKLSDTRSHWKVRGPLGISAEFVVEITASVPNERLAWKTVTDTPLTHSGSVVFRPEGDGTRAHLQMHYRPVGGAIGDTVAHLIGADAKHQLESALLSMKTFVETGKVAAHASA